MRHAPTLMLLLLAAAACSGSPPAVPVVQPGVLVSTRAELEQRLADYETALSSSQLSEEERREMTLEADAIRQRLEYGDFRVGDRIILSVQGEEALPDTVQVLPGRIIELPLFGDIPVDGVLRSELTEHLEQALTAYIRDPVVRSNGLMRVSVLGAVGAPGFYTMPAETVLGDAIMTAGGPARNANLDQVRIRRGAEEIMDGDEVRLALQQGMTLDQLSLQAGDQIEVPETRGILQILAIVSSVAGSLGFVLWRLL